MQIIPVMIVITCLATPLGAGQPGYFLRYNIKFYKINIVENNSRKRPMWLGVIQYFLLDNSLNNPIYLQINYVKKTYVIPTEIQDFL